MGSRPWLTTEAERSLLAKQRAIVVLLPNHKVQDAREVLVTLSLGVGRRQGDVG